MFQSGWRLGTAEPREAGAAQDAPAVFRVLGPLEVCRGERVAVTARRQAIVLAMLLTADRAVSVDALTDAVWGVRPPHTARAQVQTVVSVLRRTFAQVGLGERIVQTGQGYRIETRPGELDLHVFDELAARGRGALRDQDPHTARDAFRRALALWRGEPFTGLDSDALRARARHIAERRVEVLEECLDAELRLGLHHEALGEVKALAAEYPLRERPAMQLMTALYRCGRRAESLAVYQAVRRTFVDELGLEPGPALRRLELAILNGSADLEPGGGAAVRSSAETRVPRMLPAPVPDFTGCEEVLGAVRRHLAGRQDLRAPRIAVVAGGLGVGKSAVAVQAAHSLAAAFPDGQLYARATDDEPDACDVLGTLLAALGHTGAAVPDSAQGRAALYRSALVQRRVLVVVDDLTRESQLRALAPGTADSALLVTARTRLDVTPGTAVYEVCVPDARGGVRLLAGMLGRDRVAAEPSEALELVELCGALPLALRAASARLRLRPQWTLADLTGRLRDERRRLDELAGPEFDPRAGCDAACARLDAAGIRLLRRLALLEEEDFPAWVASPLLDLDPRAAADVLETLVDARLVEARRGPATGMRYRLPGLVRLRARERLAAEEPETERSAALRRLLGAWLALAASAVARYGGDPADLPGTAPRWPAGADPVALPGPDPLAWYEQERGGLLSAVRLAAAADAALSCWSLALALAPLAQAQCRFDDWRESHELALATARRGGDRLGEAVLLSSLGALDLCERRFDRAAARLGVALDALDQLGERRWAQLTRRSLRALERAGGPAARPVGTRHGGEDAPAAVRRAPLPASRGAFSRRHFDLTASGVPEAPPAAARRTTASHGPSGNERAGSWPPDRPARRTPDTFGEL
jgi:DNA-binding SARP family transcriptional activator